MDINNSTPEELEGEALNNSMRSDDGHIIGQDEQATPTTPSPILKGAEEFSFENGSYKINLSSAFLRVDQLAEICYLILTRHKRKQDKG